MHQSKEAAQHRVQPTWGTRRVILSFFSAGSLSRFGGESTLPPQAANASRSAAGNQGLLPQKESLRF